MPHLGPWPATPAERRTIRDHESRGVPFLLFRDRDEAQVIVPLDDADGRVAIGRRESMDVALDWDDRVSRAHAQMERTGGEWLVSDSGSRNGTFVNEERVQGRRRLRDGDIVRAGQTRILFRDPLGGSSEPTEAGSWVVNAPPLTAQQAKVLASLCRPCLEQRSLATPSTNEEIARELFLSVDAVKAHLRELYRRFEVDRLPQIQKRTALARIAIESGIVRRET